MVFSLFWHSNPNPEELKMSQGSEEVEGWGVSQMTRTMEDEVATKLQAGYRLGGFQNPNVCIKSIHS